MIIACEHFRRVRALEHSKALERRKWFIAAKQRKAHKDALTDEAETSALDMAITTVLAEPIELEAFGEELDAYDEATVKALLKNREILEELYEKREALLDSAYQLDDGTRVFKSEDGSTIINEFGHIVTTDVITADEIEDHYPKAEPYLTVMNGIEKHERIDQELHEYQNQLDDARERRNSGKMTKEELEETRQTLQSGMPIQIGEQLPEDLKPTSVSLKGEFQVPANQIPATVSVYNRMPDFALN